MNKGKEKEGTNASTFDDHLNIGLRRTPGEANPEEHQKVGSICCPNCCHKFEPTPEMLVEFFEQFMGKIGGVKFEPSDQQLIDHLEAKVNRSGDHKPNPLTDEFIATIEGDEGICYTHPDRLPGVTIDGTSKHFFHKSSKAYKTGTRKRRRIHSNKHYEFSETRWHKTGKTRPVISDNGNQKGCKKILVLYTDFGKSKRPTKTNWIMHQYHLGGIHDEKEGELVVSKIFYQTHPRQPSEDRKYASGNEYSESANNSEVPSEQKVQPEAREQIGYVQMPHNLNIQELPPRLNIEELPPQVTAMPAFHLDTSKPPPQVLPMQAFHLNAPNGPFTPVAMAPDHPPMHEASAILANNYQQNMLPSSNYQLEQQQQVHGNTTFSLEEIMTGCTSADPKEGTSNANSNSNAEWPGFFNWQTNSTQDPPGPHN